VLLVRKKTGRLPKQNKLKRLLNPTNADECAASNRFKNCIRRPVMHVNEKDGGPRGSGAEGTWIVCNKTTDWYCVDCGNWCSCATTGLSPMVWSTSGISTLTMEAMVAVIILPEK
jgi:hypothetical protein